jgi:hypothetical protein
MDEQICTEVEPIQEFPKMLYAHPVDKTQEHKTIIVNSPEEKAAAISNGYKEEPHVPVSPEEYETTVYDLKDAQGIGSERGFAGEDDPEKASE